MLVPAETVECGDRAPPAPADRQSESAMSDNSTIFSGTSRYANDFQQIINRSVAIASLPMTQLEAQKTTLSDQSSALGALDSKFAALQSSLLGMASASGSSWSTSVSDGSVAKADLTDGALAGVYSVQVAGLGSSTSAMPAPRKLSAASRS